MPRHRWEAKEAEPLQAWECAGCGLRMCSPKKPSWAWDDDLGRECVTFWLFDDDHRRGEQEMMCELHSDCESHAVSEVLKS